MASGTAIEIALQEGKALLEKALAEKGFTTPTIVFTEEENSIKLVITGGNVDSNTGGFEETFRSDFWKGILRIDQTNPMGSSDTLTVTVLINHQAGPRAPHLTDIFKGEVASLSLTIDSTEKGDPDGGNFKRVKGPTPKDAVHSMGHSDKYKATLTAIIAEGFFVNNILSWTYELTGQHTDVTVASLNIQDASASPGGVASVVILANKNVPTMGSLALTLGFDGRLELRDTDIHLAPHLSEPTSRFDCSRPGRVALFVWTKKEVLGPGVIATLDFRVPKVRLQRAYGVTCSHLAATDLNGSPLEIGCNDGIVTVNA